MYVLKVLSRLDGKNIKYNKIIKLNYLVLEVVGWVL